MQSQIIDLLVISLIFCTHVEKNRKIKIKTMVIATFKDSTLVLPIESVVDVVGSHVVCLVCPLVGLVVGSVVRDCVGSHVVLLVGPLVGSVVGSVVGDVIGDGVGTVVGDGVGTVVGDGVGDVGSLVGDGVQSV